MIILNREDRRALQKKLRDKSVRTHAADILNSLGDAVNDIIRDGDLVTLNVQRITGRKEYRHMQERYRQFVESSRGKVFVARSHHARSEGFSAVMELEGIEWTFWYGDLIRVENIQAEGDE